MSQLYPRTKEQEKSSGMTYKSRFIQLLVEKIMGKLAILEMVLFDKLSNKQRATREFVEVFKWWVSTNLESIKQWVDSEPIRAQNRILLR